MSSSSFECNKSGIRFSKVICMVTLESVMTCRVKFILFYKMC